MAQLFLGHMNRLAFSIYREDHSLSIDTNICGLSAHWKGSEYIKKGYSRIPLSTAKMENRKQKALKYINDKYGDGEEKTFLL